MFQAIKRLLTALKFLRRHLSNPESKTYYPEDARKSPWAIFLDNLRWMLKHREINHYYFAYGFDRKKGVNQDDYLPDQSFYEFRNKLNAIGRVGTRQTNYISLLKDKFVFSQFLHSLHLPTPRLLALCDKHTVTWLDSRTTEPIESLLNKQDLDVFVKELLGESGDGIYRLKITQHKMYLNDQPTTISQLSKIIKDKCIIQERITQHSRINELYPHSVNTLRLITARANTKPTLLSALFRFGLKGHQTDNCTVGGIAVGIDIKTGKLTRYGKFLPGHGGKIEQHPDTHTPFAGFQIPYFFESVHLAKKLHRLFYGIHSVGWDIAITPDGPSVIEGNEYWGLPTIQMHDHTIKKNFFATLPTPRPSF